MYAVPRDVPSDEPPPTAQHDNDEQQQLSHKHSFAGFLGAVDSPVDSSTPNNHHQGTVNINEEDLATVKSGAFYAGRFHNTTNSTSSRHLGRNPNWTAQRREIFSEINFNVPYFLKSMLYEVVPTMVSGPFVYLFSNKAESMNRSFWPPNFVIDISVYFTIYWVTYCTIYYPSPGTTYYDALSLWVYVFARGATIGVKYGLYGDLDKDEHSGIRSKLYHATGRQGKNLISEIVYNLHSKQMSVLAENLFTSMLKRDCDLSCARIQFQSSSHAIAMLNSVKKSIHEIYDVDIEETMELKKAGLLFSDAGAAAGNISNSKKRAKGTTVDRSVHKRQTGETGSNNVKSLLKNHKFSTMRRRKKKEDAPKEFSPAIQTETDRREGLLHDLIRLDMNEIEKMARETRSLPAVIVALHCLSVTHKTPSSIGTPLFLCSVLIGILCSFVPAITRAFEGKIAFGSTQMEQSVFGCAVVSYSFWFFIMNYYCAAPLYFFIKHLRVEKYLHRMLAGKWDEHSLQLGQHEVYFDDDGVDHGQGVDDGRGSGPADLSANDHLLCPPPQIDLSVPDNVVSFAALRRVLHGGNFAPIFQRRFSYDLLLSLMTVGLDAAIQNFGARFDSNNTTFASKMASTIRLMILAALITPQIVVTWYINRFTDFHTLEIARGRLANLAMASAVRSKERAAELMRAAFFLESLETEIAADDRSNPVRVGMFRANLTLLATLSSMITGVLYFDLQNLFVTSVNAAGGGGSGVNGQQRRYNNNGTNVTTV
jgi:hypothetical protein